MLAGLQTEGRLKVAWQEHCKHGKCKFDQYNLVKAISMIRLGYSCCHA